MHPTERSKGATQTIDKAKQQNSTVHNAIISRRKF